MYAPPLQNEMATVAYAEDQVLFRKALVEVINGFENCRVVLEADNGLQIQEGLAKGIVPGIIILDVSMPRLNGYQTALWLKQHHPGIPVLMLTVFENTLLVPHLWQAGVKGILGKDILPLHLEEAIRSVSAHHHYFRKGTKDAITWHTTISGKYVTLTQKEIILIKHLGTNLSYKEIADEMEVANTNVEHLRDALFKKFDSRNRTELALMAVDNGLTLL